MNNSIFNKIEGTQPPSNNHPILSQGFSVPEQLTQNIPPKVELSFSSPETFLKEEQMIAERQRRVLREELKCSICFDLFRQPVSLPACGHTFCRVCIEAYLQHSPPPTQPIAAGSEQMAAAFVHCPLCRRPSCITRAGSEWRLVENLIAANMVERVIGIHYYFLLSFNYL